MDKEDFTVKWELIYPPGKILYVCIHMVIELQNKQKLI